MQLVVLDGHTLNPGDNPWDDLARLGELVVYDRTLPDQVLPRARDAEIALTNKTVLSGSVNVPLNNEGFRAAAVGTVATSCSVRTSNWAFTNWLGNNA